MDEMKVSFCFVYVWILCLCIVQLIVLCDNVCIFVDFVSFGNYK